MGGGRCGERTRQSIVQEGQDGSAQARTLVPLRAESMIMTNGRLDIGLARGLMPAEEGEYTENDELVLYNNSSYIVSTRQQTAAQTAIAAGAYISDTNHPHLHNRTREKHNNPYAMPRGGLTPARPSH